MRDRSNIFFLLNLQVSMSLLASLFLIIIHLLSPPSFLVRLFYILFSYRKTIEHMQKKERTFSYVLMSKQVYDLIISYNTSFTLILDTNQ